MKPRILIIVEGGIVQAVHANQDIDIVIVDYDDKSDETCIVSEVLSPDTIIEQSRTFHEELFTIEDEAKLPLAKLDY